MQLQKVNTLFDAIPTGPDLGIIVRFPVRYMTDIELSELAGLRNSNEFFIGYIDFTVDTEDIDEFIVNVGSLQEAVEVMVDNVPFFDVHLN